MPGLCCTVCAPRRSDTPYDCASLLAAHPEVPQVACVHACTLGEQAATSTVHAGYGLSSTLRMAGGSDCMRKI